jgi:hypothetical protein
MKNMFARLAIVAVVATGVPALTGSAAHAGDDDDNRVERNGSCSNGARWKIKAKADDGRIEVEAEIDTNKAGQSWGWVLMHDGSVSARGTSRTNARSGSFEVERKTVNAAGVDSFQFRATRNGAVCVATVSY